MSNPAANPDPNDLAVSHGEITGGCRVSRKTLNLLLSTARDKGRTVENRRKGDVDNWYIDNRLFGTSTKGWCCVVIKI